MQYRGHGSPLIHRDEQRSRSFTTCEGYPSIHQTMRDEGVGNSELGRRLGWHMPQADRLLDPNHVSRLDQAETALAALGRRLTVEVR